MTPYADPQLEQSHMWEQNMAGDARSKLIAELVSEFVEERVRQFPTQVFDLAAVKRAVATAIKEGGAGFELMSGDDRALASLLDQHPFLVRAKDRNTLAWRPGLDKARPR